MHAQYIEPASLCRMCILHRLACKGRKRNAGDARNFCTALVPIPSLKPDKGSSHGTLLTFPPAFLFSLVFLFALTLTKIVTAYARTKTRQLLPGRSGNRSLHTVPRRSSLLGYTMDFVANLIKRAFDIIIRKSKDIYPLLFQISSSCGISLLFLRFIVLRTI